MKTGRIYKPRLGMVFLAPLLLIFACGIAPADRGTGDVPRISWDPQNGLQYTYDARGNRIPDFSHCGYRCSETNIPDVPIRLVLAVPDGDATPLLQGAIDHLSTFPLDENGFRGTILLGPGTYRLKGRLKISASGIVLRGSGMNQGGTVLLAGGTGRMTLIRVAGVDDRKIMRTYRISDGYVPAGTDRLHIDGRHALEEGDRVLIHRPSTREWIDALSMDYFGGETAYLGWKPGERDLYWERSVSTVNGNSILLDAPLTTALDSAIGRGKLISFAWPGRIRNVGIENLKMMSEYDAANPKDEAHCWMAVTMENVEDAWVRRVEFSHFAGSAAAVYETARRITVEDCISLAPVSEIGGQRRYTFFTMGQQCLFQRLYAEYGYHDFATGFCAAGPNAFVECESHLPHSFSGTIDSWASGTLFDLVRVDGQALRLMDRGPDAMGSGWTAANSMLWQCSAARLDCYSPPGATNWAYGCWGQPAGNGCWEESNNHIQPRSLFYAQLAGRLQRPAEEFSGRIMPFRAVSSTSPTPSLAEELNREAYAPAPLLVDWIREADTREPITTSAAGVEIFDPETPPASTTPASTSRASETPVSTALTKTPLPPVRIHNGWLVRDGKLLCGGMLGVPWWRGDARPYAAGKASPAITRYVPGRYGQGYTDELDKLAESLGSGHVVAMDHNYGLWYDRRRDDHQRVRRMDGEVWAPFYEQPFARSGEGTAWDGLSKYDLTRYNDWYWDRLRGFADEAEKRGILLLHQQYFQHNILEAGAHYADFPWRTANNINSTGFPEPPNYAGDKRIFMDGQFYDTLHPVRKQLHRSYIRKCLENFAGNSNVIQLTGAEYTGPLHFMQFWLDVIRDWEAETGQEALVALSATKDVQDAILTDPVRSTVVDLIDIRYWAYREDGSLYAPEGGQHMAPRQHSRKIDPGTRSFEQVYRAVQEYRQAYPDKAVICSENESARFGWAVLLAGGSIPRLPAALPQSFLEDAAGMQPVATESGIPALANDQGEMILYAERDGTVELDLSPYKGTVYSRWIHPVFGTVRDEVTEITLGNRIELNKPETGPLVLWLSAKPPK